MKRRIALLLILICAKHTSIAQSTPYTGGDGSGYLSQNSAPVICSNFFGGDADGATIALSAPTACPSFFGGDADGYSGSQTVGCNVVLASRLIKFYGEKELLRNVLHWKLTGFDAKQFDIQKSSDGTTFTSFGTVAGSTNDNIIYLFIDDAPFPNVTFYRLRITERNLIISYSDILALKDISTSRSIIYPNPSKGSSMLYYYAERPQTITLNITQVDGKKMIAKTIVLNAGKNNIPLDLQYLPNGIYFIRLGANEKVFKLIVAR